MIFDSNIILLSDVIIAGTIPCGTISKYHSGFFFKFILIGSNLKYKLYFSNVILVQFFMKRTVYF
jgi:hypothetical protein